MEDKEYQRHLRQLTRVVALAVRLAAKVVRSVQT